jgi:hypothetical protein
MEKLAIEGGPKVVADHSAGWPEFDEKAISAVPEAILWGSKQDCTALRSELG